MTCLSCQGLSVHVGNKALLDDVALDLREGELVGLIGPNGAGKSTLLRALLRLQTWTGGRVTLGGKELQDLSRTTVAKCVGYLAQGGEVYWPLTVERVVALGRLPHRAPWKALGVEDRNAIDAALEATDVLHLRSRIITTLSGGERMRALLARVLAGDPELILADEPLASLDPFHQLRAMDVFRDVVRSGGSVLLVLHDLSLAARFCDRVILLHQGKVAAGGTPAQVLRADNIASVYRVEALVRMEGEQPLVVPWRALP